MKARGALLDINLHTITMMNNIKWFGADIGTYDISPQKQPWESRRQLLVQMPDIDPAVRGSATENHKHWAPSLKAVS